MRIEKQPSNRGWMTVTEKHYEILRALILSKDGVKKKDLPNIRNVYHLIKYGFVESSGFDWVAVFHITDEGRNLLMDK